MTLGAECSAHKRYYEKNGNGKATMCVIFALSTRISNIFFLCPVAKVIWGYVAM
jgi:hypothetical protein